MRSTLALLLVTPVTLAQYTTNYLTSYSSTYTSSYPYGQSCYSQASCAWDETCVSGICLKSRGASPAPTQRCTLNTDCGASQICAGGNCVSSSWRCTRNTQCNYNEACLGGTCQPLFASNPPGSGYWCNVDSQCSVYETCQNYHCVRCQAGQCLNRGSLNPCWDDTQCLLAETCTAGLCQTKPCRTDNQCGYTEVCDPTNHVCVDCTSTLTLGGNAGVYNPSYGTSSTASCLGTGSGYWCYSDSQCPMNEVCDGSQCRSTGPPVPYQCSSDAQCGYNQRCNAGLCVVGQNQGRTACQYDSECAYNQICQNTVCVSGGYSTWVPHN
jgi:hypothetical protein